ncbi:MAG: Fur family transcriptional regulator [Paracoccaceae bacterium]
MTEPCSACLSTEAASQAISKRGARMTGLRRDVLSVLHHQGRALGAYEIVEQLEDDGKSSAPAAVYRVLDFLVENGLAHKIEGLSAYCACTGSGVDGPHTSVLLVCLDCGAVAENPCKIDAPLGGFNAQSGFKPLSTTVESLGVCAACLAQTNA